MGMVIRLGGGAGGVIHRVAPLSHKWERELLNFVAIQ
jgi:hypothetical protein